MTDDVLCDLCFPGYEYIGSFGDLIVFRYNNKISLTDSYHKDLLGVFNSDPVPDPLWGMSDDEIEVYLSKLSPDDIENLIFGWPEMAEDGERILASLGFSDSYRLMKLFITIGYDKDEDGSAGMWLYHRIGELLKESSD